MKRLRQMLQYVTKSEFLRSIFFRLLSVFLIMIVLLVAIMSYSFGAEIDSGIISDQKMQLNVLESAVSSRMEEVTSIVYNIGQDPMFLLEPVADDRYSGYEMSAMLSRYLVGNRFITYLVYYRLSEPDKVYSSCGELSFRGFWDAYLPCDNDSQAAFIEEICGSTGVRLIPLSAEGEGVLFYAYICPLPQFSANPQAFVIALIPYDGIASLLSAQLSSNHGGVALYGADGERICGATSLEEDVPAVLQQEGEDGLQTVFRQNGKRYSLHQKTSDTNGWTYVSVMRMNSALSGLAGTQMLVIFAVVVLMIAAVCIILVGIISKYRPISNLAQTLADPKKEPGGMIDEKTLLSSTIATLRIDSEQKQQIEAAYREASEASKAKSAFLSNMSHDIRTPMNAIIGMTGIALKHKDDAAYVHECLQKVEVASRYLLDIINNVLDMSRIESGKMTLTREEIDLPELVRGVLTIIHTSVEEKHQQLTVEAAHVVREKVIGDSVRLTQVCMNILSNAIKFTPEGGRVGMRITQTDAGTEETGTYTFVFTDTGIGMSPAFVGHVFDTFTRADDAGVSKVEGTGLGMSIAKNLVELMGGAISCESTPGQGTTFTVTLPLPFAPEETPAADAAYRDLPVLIVGGEEDCARQKALCSEAGLCPFCADGTEQAAAMLLRARSDGSAYAYILINPAADDPAGGKAVSRLREAAGGADMRCVLVARDFMGVDREAAARAGYDRVLRAPLFLSSIRHMFGAADTAEEPADGGEASAVMLDGKRVLLVEDNRMNREIARRIIAETHAEVTDAVNGREAVEVFAGHAAGYFDLILMDVQMPVMDGLEAARAIRALPRADAGKVPIYAMTANTFDEDVRTVLLAGMNGHLGKPYTPEELFRVLHKAMRTES